MKIYDISMMIEEGMEVYKDRQELQPIFEVVSDFTDGGVHQTRLNLDLHTGTHLDAPLHMVEQGEPSEFFRAEQVFSLCRVLDLTEIEGGIGSADLKKHQIRSGEFILLKTKNSYSSRTDDFIYLAEDGADYLVEKEIVGVGIDALGIERNQPGHPTHKIILSRKILLLEGLRLADVESGTYNILLAPLKIRGSDAAPARVFLISEINLPGL